MKRLALVVVAGILAGLLCLAWAWQQWTGPGPLSPAGQTSVRIRIPRGMTLSAAADTLVARGLVAHRRTLLVGAWVTDQRRGLQAGLYELSYGQSPAELLDNLTSGQSVQVEITIPEGLNSREIARKVAAKFNFTPAEFLATADSLARESVRDLSLLGSTAAMVVHDSLLAQGGEGVAGIFHWSEGLLAPDTYRFAEGSSAETVAAVLVAAQCDRLQQAVAVSQQGGNEDLSPLALLTLASIVETEARHDDERGRIAAVYTNRLHQNWRLEADPTVAFVLGKKGKRLFFKDLKVESPYNTYRVKGLPPGPIGTPGLASLMATAKPDSTCEAMYFVSDGAGGHVFSRTAREHEAAVQHFRAVRSGQRH